MSIRQRKADTQGIATDRVVGPRLLVSRYQDAACRLRVSTLWTWISDSVQPFNLNSSNWQIIRLQWLWDVTSFSQDLSVYVWQPHLEPLTTLSASIYIGPKTTDSSPRNAVLLLRCSKLMDRPLLSTTRWLQSCALSSIQELSGTEIEILSIVLSLYSPLILDTCFLISSLFSEIKKLVGIPIGTMSFW
jgi:hypothetical protein